MFWSIRTKFLSAFIIGVMITLAAAMFASYASISSAYENINERTMNAEFDQISGEITMLLDETETLISSRVMTGSALESVLRYGKLTVPEFSYAVLDMRSEFTNISTNFPFIDSMYVNVQDDWVLGMSSINTQLLYEPERWPSNRIMECLASAEVTLEVIGDVRPKEFPFESHEPAYLMLYRSINTKYGRTSYCINVRESAVEDKYSGFMEDGTRTIRILDSAGMIISSADKSEIGTYLEVLQNESLSSGGMVNEDGVVTSYTPIRKYGLVITNSIPSSIYTSELSSMRNRLLLVFAVGMLGISAFFTYWIEQRLKPIGALRQGMRCAGQGDYSQHLPVTGADELTELTENYNTMLSDLQTLHESRRKAELELRERELAVLRNEINPHFLYNTLNTIKCMADLEGNKEIARCAVALGGIVAPLYKVQGPTWTLREEITLIGKYLEIMNIRYGNGISYMEDIPVELLDRQIMRFILQPIVENSILHGFLERAYFGKIIIRVKVEEQGLLIRVDDDGTGITDEKLDQFNMALQAGHEAGGVGMMNVSRRITLRYGAPYGIRLQKSEYGGLCTCILLPEEDTE